MGDELSIREAYDLLRAFYAKQVKPFEKFPQALEAAIQVMEHDLPAAKRELENLTTFIARLRAETPDVETAQAAAAARVKTAEDQAAAGERASGEKIRQAEALAAARETQLVRDFEFKGATLQREYEERRALLEQEVTMLETQKRDLDVAITALRAKFA